MVSLETSKTLRAVIASMMIALVVATPVAGAVAPVANAPVPASAVDPDPDPVSDEALRQALAQLGLLQQPCQEGESAAERDTNGMIWFLGGCVLGVLAVVGAYVIEPSPPASALVGQTPEYVAQYTDCYVERAQAIQTRNALYGCLTQGVLWVGYYVLWVVVFATATSDL